MVGNPSDKFNCTRVWMIHSKSDCGWMLPFIGDANLCKKTVEAAAKKVGNRSVFNKLNL